MEFRDFEVIVIGLGAVGSASLYQLSKAGVSVLGIDRFDPPHRLGSSHGETRITRLAVGESDAYVPMVKRSHEIWREIEAMTGNAIFTECGGVLLDSGKTPWAKHGVDGFFKSTVTIADQFGIAHQTMSSDQLKMKYPLLQLEEEGTAYFEYSAGYLRPEAAIQAQINLAEMNGAIVLRNSRVLQVKKRFDSKVQVEIEGESLVADVVINCTGGWIKDFLSQTYRSKFKICRQILHWVKIDQEDWKDYPVFMWGHGPNPEDFIYGFPSLDGISIKMATESFEAVDHPDQIIRDVGEEEQQKFWKEQVEPRFGGLKPEFLKSEVCFYTVSEDAKFFIQKNVDNEQEWMVSACSGHGFKHSAALGEYLADRILQRAPRFIL